MTASTLGFALGVLLGDVFVAPPVGPGGILTRDEAARTPTASVGSRSPPGGEPHVEGEAGLEHEVLRDPRVEEGARSAEVTIHLDHLFFDTDATDEPNMRFEPFAAAAEDGIVTLDDLTAQSIADLRHRDGSALSDAGGDPVVYDPGPLPLEGTDLRAYVLAAATTVGHFNGEGHCEYEVE